MTSKYVRGLKAEYFYDIGIEHGKATRDTVNAVFTRLPNFVRLDPQIYYPLTGYGFPGISVTENFAVRWSGQLLITKGGIYTFNLRSDDGSQLAIDSIAVLGHHDHPDFDEHMWSDEPEHWLYLQPGEHDLIAHYFNTWGEAGCILQYMGPDSRGLWITVPSEVLCCDAASLPEPLARDSLMRKFSPGLVEGFGTARAVSLAAVAMGSIATLVVLTGVGIAGIKEFIRRLRLRRSGGSELRQILASYDDDDEGFN